jgi:hypothetical protein
MSELVEVSKFLAKFPAFSFGIELGGKIQNSTASVWQL